MEIFGWTPKKIMIVLLIGLSVWILQKLRSLYFYSEHSIEEYFTNTEKKDCTACNTS